MPKKAPSTGRRSKGAGRPTGATTGKYQLVDAHPTRCPKCGSTERSDYFGTVERSISGIRDGQPHTHIIWRRTQCLSCGQLRQDRSYENRV